MRSRAINRRGICFYRDNDKDFLFVWRDPKSLQNLEGCANAIKNCPSSVCWTTISNEYLRNKCHRVTRETVASFPAYSTLLMRADWMDQEMLAHGEAVLPYPPIE